MVERLGLSRGRPAYGVSVRANEGEHGLSERCGGATARPGRGVLQEISREESESVSPSWPQIADRSRAPVIHPGPQVEVYRPAGRLRPRGTTLHSHESCTGAPSPPGRREFKRPTPLHAALAPMPNSSRGRLCPIAFPCPRPSLLRPRVVQRNPRARRHPMEAPQIDVTQDRYDARCNGSCWVALVPTCAAQRGSGRRPGTIVGEREHLPSERGLLPTRCHPDGRTRMPTNAREQEPRSRRTRRTVTDAHGRVLVSFKTARINRSRTPPIDRCGHPIVRHPRRVDSGARSRSAVGHHSVPFDATHSTRCPVTEETMSKSAS